MAIAESRQPAIAPNPIPVGLVNNPKPSIAQKFAGTKSNVTNCKARVVRRRRSFLLVQNPTPKNPKV